MYGDKADEVFREVRDLGGYGDVEISNPGGLGILGALRDDNTAISNKAKDRIAELAQVDRKKDVENHEGAGVERRTKPTAKE